MRRASDLGVNEDEFRPCRSCNKMFWHVNSQVVHCGDRDCNDYDVVYKTYSPKTRKWESFSHFLDNFRTYFTSRPLSFSHSTVSLRRPSTVLKRSSTAMNFLTAGISSYQTLLQSERGDPKLETFAGKVFVTTPFCFRFKDLLNVGKTNRHCTGFFMNSLHLFESDSFRFPLSWKDECAGLILDYYVTELEIPLDKIFVHKDYWTDGVNGGQSKEFFINGIQQGNSVFMEDRPESKVAKLKIWDVGLGAQRNYVLTTPLHELKYPTCKIYESVRSLLVATKDGLMPGKRNVHQNVRELFTILIEEAKEVDLDPIVREVLNDLASCTDEREFSDGTVETLFKDLMRDQRLRLRKLKALRPQQ